MYSAAQCCVCTQCVGLKCHFSSIINVSKGAWFPNLWRNIISSDVMQVLFTPHITWCLTPIILSLETSRRVDPAPQAVADGIFRTTLTASGWGNQWVLWPCLCKRGVQGQDEVLFILSITDKQTCADEVEWGSFAEVDSAQTDSIIDL